MENIVELTSPHYRPGTKTKKTRVNFVLTAGGIGDYICHLVAIDWIFQTQNHVEGVIWAPEYFLEIPMFLYNNKNGWTVKDRKLLTDEEAKATPSYIPNHRTFINGVGAHLSTMGFIYFTNMVEAPEKRYLPKFDVELLPIRPSVEQQIPTSPYVVLTPCATESTRQMPASLFNKIQEHAWKRGLEIVYLGKQEMGERGKAFFDQEIDLSRGVNLINKTTLLEAAHVMSRSAAVIGLDNGLLHLAACTDAPIIFGYNVISPKLRRPWRNSNALIIDIFPDKKVLPCTFCMEGMRYIFGHNFKHCIYKDEYCLKELADNPERWENAIDSILGIQ